MSWFRDSTRWLTAGRLDRRMMALGITFVAVSGVTLLLWTSPRVPISPISSKRAFRSDRSGCLYLAELVFSLVNAAFEEAVYRGVLPGRARRRLTAPAVLILQAVAFAALHFRAGFPRGIVGLGLTFVYGVLLGALRRRAGGLAAPFITHVLTDAVIVTIVLALVRP